MGIHEVCARGDRSSSAVAGRRIAGHDSSEAWDELNSSSFSQGGYHLLGAETPSGGELAGLGRADSGRGIW